MSKLANLQIIWPPVPTLILVSLADWIKSFDSQLVSFAALFVYLYVMFAPALIAVLWPKKRGSE